MTSALSETSPMSLGTSSTPRSASEPDLQRQTTPISSVPRSASDKLRSAHASVTDVKNLFAPRQSIEVGSSSPSTVVQPDGNSVASESSRSSPAPEAPEAPEVVKEGGESLAAELPVELDEPAQPVIGVKRTADEMNGRSEGCSPGSHVEAGRVVANHEPQMVVASEPAPPQTPLRYRQTPESAANAHLKLAKPFRSPMLTKSNSKSSPLKPAATPLSNSSSPTVPDAQPSHHQKRKIQSPLLSVKNTKSASKPFRSPLSKSTSSSSPADPSSSTTTAFSAASTRLRIQSLEKRLSILKQAAKYRSDGSTAHLQELVVKWRGAAREAAQELWALAEGGGTSGGEGGGGKDSGGWGYDGEKEDDVLAVLKGSSKKFGEGWGWDEGDKTAVAGDAEESGDESMELPSPDTLLASVPRSGPTRAEWHSASLLSALDASPSLGSKGKEIEEDEVEVKKEEHTIGSMLTMLGIPKETLGWDDGEEDFVD